MLRTLTQKRSLKAAGAVAQAWRGRVVMLATVVPPHGMCLHPLVVKNSSLISLLRPCQRHVSVVKGKAYYIFMNHKR